MHFAVSLKNVSLKNAAFSIARYDSVVFRQFLRFRPNTISKMQ